MNNHLRSKFIHTYLFLEQSERNVGYYDIEGYNEKYPDADDGFAAFFQRTLKEGLK